MLKSGELIRAAIQLKQPTPAQIGGEVNTIAGVNFKWNANDKMWILMNPVGFAVKTDYEMFCRVCKKMEKHIVNKDGTKVKAVECGTITELKL